ADQERVDAAGDSSEGERERRADMRVLEHVEERRHREVLRLRIDREDPGEVCADGDEAHVPERDHAGVADEDVERDDDRDHHDRVLELELLGRRDVAGDQGSEQYEGDRYAELEDRTPHTRSTRAARNGANRPAGRSSSTTTTSP